MFTHIYLRPPCSPPNSFTSRIPSIIDALEEENFSYLGQEKRKRGDKNLFKRNLIFSLSEASDATLGLGAVVGFI